MTGSSGESFSACSNLRDRLGVTAKSSEVRPVNLVDFRVGRSEFERPQQIALDRNLYAGRSRRLVSQRKPNERRQTSMMIGRIAHQEVNVTAGTMTGLAADQAFHSASKWWLSTWRILFRSFGAL